MKELYPTSKMEEHDEMYNLNNASTDWHRVLGSSWRDHSATIKTLCKDQYGEFAMTSSEKGEFGDYIYKSKCTHWGEICWACKILCMCFILCMLLVFILFCGPSVSERHNLSMPFCNNFCQRLSLSNMSQFESLHTRNTSQITLPVACAIIPIMEYTRMSKVH